MKDFLKKLFPSVAVFRNRIYNYVAHYRFKGKSADEVFRIIYEENHWKDSESVSGTGSSKKNSEAVVKIIEEVNNEFKIRSLLDIPCGDFNWMKKVDLGYVHYLGGDIVQALIENNNFSFATDFVSFKKLNLLESPLPEVDLIFTRDCLVHFSFSDVKTALSNIKRSKSTFFLTTTFPDHQNRDIITGDWRPLNLQSPPFNFPDPIRIFNERCQEESGRYKDKSLGLWYSHQIPDLID